MGIGLMPAPVDTVGIEAQVQAVHDIAVEADARAANAQTMVRNRDPRLANLEDVASKFTEEIARTDKIHADLQAGINAAMARTMTPGPKGDPGPPGASVKGDKGDPGTPADMTRVAALETAVSALQALKVTVGFGVANLPASLAAGATTNVVVTLSRSMGSATYSVGYGLAGGTSLLGALQATGVVAQTATTVTVAVRNTGLTALLNLNAASLSVVAARDA